jgi:hypothetical protein
MVGAVKSLTFEEAMNGVRSRSAKALVEVGENGHIALAVLKCFELSAVGPWRLIRGYEVRKEGEGVRAILYFDGGVDRYNELVVGVASVVSVAGAGEGGEDTPSARVPTVRVRLLLRRVSKACVTPLRAFLTAMRGLLRRYDFDFYAKIEGALRPDVLIDVARMGFEPVKGSDGSVLELDGRRLSLAFP